jgi:alpha-beta hydrolase superfamily lysophospholipase
MALVVGVAIGGPHLAKEGWSTGTVVGLVAAVAGVGLLVVAGSALRDLRWWGRIAVGLGALALLGATMLTLGQAVAANWVPRTEVGRTPADVGLAAEDVLLRTSDDVELAGWYVAPENGVAVVLAHGAGSTRSAILEHAEVLVDHGYGVLAFDARGHGESEGRAMDFGWWGDEDVTSAVDFLDAQAGVDHIAALGLSMGGEEVFGAMAAEPRLEATVAEGATIRVAQDRAWLSSVYGWRGAAQEWLESATMWWVDRFTSADPPASLRSAVAEAAPRPVLLLTAGEVVDEAHAATWIEAGSPSSVTVVELPGAGHTDGLRTDPDLWTDTVIGFLDDALPS